MQDFEIRIAGLDLSVAKAGVVIRDYGEDEPVYAECLDDGGTKGIHRLHHWKYVIPELLNEWDVDFFVIEGYAYSRANQAHQIGEVSGLVRLTLWEDLGLSFLIVPPGTLKKHLTGKGNSPKSVMIKEVYKRWRFNTDNDNIADAYALTKLGHDFLMNDGSKIWKTLLKACEYVD